MRFRAALFGALLVALAMPGGVQADQLDESGSQQVGPCVGAAHWVGSFLFFPLRTRAGRGFGRWCRPGDNPGANLKSISHRCHSILVAFVLTKETIHLPLGCPRGGLI